MKLPTLEEIEILNFDYDRLIEHIPTTNIGNGPCYIVLNNLNEANTLHAINNIAQALVTLRIHPIIPYPLYVVTQTEVKEPLLPVVKNVDDLPTHFKLNNHRLKQKEVSILNKVNMLAQKIKNNDIYDRTLDLNFSVSGGRELYQVSHEIHFLDKVLRRMNGQKS